MQTSGPRNLIVGLAALAGVGLLVTGAHAQGLVQKTFKSDVVTAWQGCTPPGTSSSNSGFVACLNPQLADPLCKFSSRGKGRVRLIARTDNVSLYGSVKGIEPACTGQMLTLLVSMRITTDDCPPGVSPSQACTLVDIVDQPLGTCQVVNGNCKILGTLNEAAAGLVGLDKRTDIELMGCGFKRTSGAGLPARTFSCGIRVP
jgi:hypothetical protein